jgi:threonine dehydrogenase-like Zn-dependent dehydrogenase
MLLRTAPKAEFVPMDYIPTLRDVAKEVGEILALIKTGAIKPSRIITHRFSLDELQSAFDLIRSQPEGLAKVAIHID